MFSLHILSLNCYAVLRLLIFLLSGHRHEEARICYLETHGELQLLNPQSSVSFQINNLTTESKSTFNSDNTSF